MKYRNLALIQLFYFIFITVLLAQPNYDEQQIIPPTPTAAAITKFIDFPMDYYSGTENITIPLENIAIGDIGVDVNLSYNGGGIKVDQLSGDVGLGWNLNAGGIITRTVVDKPDELISNGYMSLKDKFIDYDEFDAFSESHYRFLEQGVYDKEPDIFSFVAGNYSGKFYFTPNGECVVVPFQDVKISWLNTDNSNLLLNSFFTFTILTPDGLRYTYGADINNLEWTVSSSSVTCGNTPGPDLINEENVVTAWRLQKIESARSNFVINFSYSPYTSTYNSNYSENLPLKLSPLTLPDSDCTQFLQPKSECLTTTTVRSCILSTISTLNKSLSFGTSNVADVNGGKHYSNIIIKDKSGVQHKKIKFVTSNVTSTGNAHSKLSSTSYIRRFLDGVKFFDKGNNEINKYVFDYGGKTKVLPPRFGFAQDYWGYYNGADENTTLFTDDNNTWKNEILDTYLGYNFADRTAQENYGSYGMLKKITYPTGGVRSYEYESNSYEDTPSENTIINTFEERAGTNWNFGNGPATSEKTVKIPHVQFVTVEYNLTFNGLERLGQKAASVEIVSDISVDKEYIKDSYGINQQLPYTLTGSEQVYLNAGEYTLKASVVNENESAEIIVSYNEYADGTTPQVVRVGGQRIKTITTKESEDDTEIIKNIGYSSHKLLASTLPKIETIRYNDVRKGGQECYVCLATTLHSSSLYALFNTQGRTIGYNYVKESFPNNGYNVYKFITYPNTGANTAPIGSDINLQMAYTDYTYKNGKMKSVESFDKLNNLIASTINTYKLANSTNRILISGVRVSNNGSSNCWTINNIAEMIAVIPNEAPILTAGWYNYTSERIYLEESIETINGVATTTTYKYDDSKPFLQLSSTKVENTSGKIYETKYKYFDEYSDNDENTDDEHVKNWLKGINIIEPWQTTTYVYNNVTDTSPTQIDGTRLSYYNFGGYFPKTFQRYEQTWNENGSILTGSWQNQYVINEYQTNLGKPTNITVDGWSNPIVYLWTSTGKLDTKTYKDFITDYNYHPNTDLLSEIIEPDGQKTTFTYDDFMRLDEISSRGGKVKKEYSYSYTPNFVQETSTFDDTGTINDITNIVKTSFDGLGREIRIDQVNHKWNNPTTDISVLKEYNNQGLLWKVYEPDDNTTSTGDNYTEYTYHPDPLGRIKSVKDPMGFTSTNAYSTNIANEVINYNNYPADETNYYPANTLYKATTTDPDGNHSSTFTDKLGRVVMTMNSNAGETKTNKTYTNYDDKSRVSTIIPPGATPADAGLIYQYTYDGADNVLTTKLPDKGLMEYHYNARNLPTAMQDANMKTNDKWLRSAYDNYGRLHQQGFSSTHKGQISDLLLHNYYDNNDTKNTVNTATPIYIGQLHKTKVNILNGFNAGTDYLNTNYTLDDYGRVSKENTTSNHIGLAESIDYKYNMADNILENKHTVGSTISTETFQFDNKGRLQTNNFSLSGKGIKTIANYASYSLKDEVLQKNIGSAAFNSYLQTVDYQYNANGWLTKINEGEVSGTNSNCASITGISRNDLFALDIRYNDASITSSVGHKNGNIAEIYWQTAGRAKNAYRFKYDYLNRLTEAKHYKNAIYEGNYDSSYSYDERGNINTLTRNGLTGNGTSCTEKQIDNLTYLYTDGTNKLSKVFDCVSQYDHEHINPIDKEIYAKKSISSDAKTNTPGENSNTKSIKFIAGTHISLQPGFEYTNKNNGEFSATISPSFCLSNSDLANHGFKGEESSYRYDANGNLSRDSQKQVSILYNHLNLPYQVTKNGGDKIEWLYTANGQKLQKKVTLSGTPSIKNYLGNMEFTQSGNINTLEAVYHSEGRVLNNGTWEYNLKDHLGNVRIVFVEGVDRSGKIVQENHYYPFGMQQNGNWVNNQTVKNDYLYNGKELNTEIGLNWSDYGARFYDASIGRWNSADPLAEMYPSHSSYNYVLNNPLIHVDPDGRSVWTKLGKAIYKVGKTVYKKGAGALKEGATYADAVSGIIDDGSTVFDGDAGVGERVGAGLSLASEILPISVGDVKDVVSSVSSLAKKAGAAKDVKKVGDTKKAGKNFDEAREEAFKGAGMDDGNVEFTKVDSKTGTVVEFKGKGGAKVGYDGPHKSPGKNHDTQHISYQSEGKRKSGGAKRDNVAYDGSQHPSRSKEKN